MLGLAQIVIMANVSHSGGPMTPQRLSPQKMHLASRKPADQEEEELSEEDEPYQEVCSEVFPGRMQNMHASGLNHSLRNIIRNL